MLGFGLRCSSLLIKGQKNSFAEMCILLCSSTFALNSHLKYGYNLENCQGG